MEGRACLKLLVLYLGFSFVLSSTAVPATSETHAFFLFPSFLYSFFYLFYEFVVNIFYVLAGMAKSDNENPIQVQEFLTQVLFYFFIFLVSELHYNQSSDI